MEPSCSFVLPSSPGSVGYVYTILILCRNSFSWPFYFSNSVCCKVPYSQCTELTVWKMPAFSLSILEAKHRFRLPARLIASGIQLSWLSAGLCSDLLFLQVHPLYRIGHNSLTLLNFNDLFNIKSHPKLLGLGPLPYGEYWLICSPTSVVEIFFQCQFT